MVEMLMKDHNLLINEIVDRVMSGVSAAAAGVRKSPSLSTSSETSVIAQQQQQQTPPISQSSSISLVSAAAVKTPQEEMRKLSLQQQTPLAKVSTGVKQSHREADMAAHQNAAAAPATTPAQQSTTNVWQKRAEAIREKRGPIAAAHSNENPLNETFPIFSASPNQLGRRRTSFLTRHLLRRVRDHNGIRPSERIGPKHADWYQTKVVALLRRAKTAGIRRRHRPTTSQHQQQRVGFPVEGGTPEEGPRLCSAPIIRLHKYYAGNCACAADQPKGENSQRLVNKRSCRN
jgi:hypothetical protein